MIIFMIRMTVREKMRNPFAESIRLLVQPARMFMGCLSYFFYKDVEKDNTFSLVQIWRDRKDMETYLRSDDFLKVLSLMDHLAEPPVIEFWNAKPPQGMEYLKTVLSTPTSEGE